MKKIFGIVITALFASQSVNAQLLGSIELDPKNFPQSTSCDNVVKNAINGSIVVVKQSYQVKHKKNGKVYGRNGRKDFGHYYSIGVKTEAGLVLTDGALKPWLYDSAFKKVEQEYEPVISLTEVRDVESDGQTKFSQYPLKMTRQQPEGLWIANAENMDSNAMEIDQEEGEKDGWLIWFTAKKDLDANPEIGITIQTINKKMGIKAGSEDFDINAPEGGDLLLGGIYVCPTYLGGGHVVYRLVGMTAKEEKQWKLRAPFMEYFFERDQADQQQQDEPAVEEAEQEQEVELTPIAQDKKKKNKK